jgi:asparagine synthase (glutamine-hydrolysing)
MFAVVFGGDGRVEVAVADRGAAVEELKGRCWIAGSIRLDARADLLAALSIGETSIGDAALCLHAYRRWGDDFVERLSGDFAFVLWDGNKQRLLAVRDQLGIRSLFYARCGTAWYVADSLDWLAARPVLDRRLDEIWIGDFLATGHSLDPTRTVYAEVHRLPPGHCVELYRDRERLRRYWRLSVERPLFLRDGEYGERFRALTTQAIRDRAPAGRLGIAMSGGVDSTTLAALSVEALGDAGRVMARCAHFETLMADDEPRFAAMAAEALGIELRLDNADCAYDPQWRERGLRSAEPTTGIVNAHNEQAITRSMAADAGVWFFGEGPDNALAFERAPYLGWLMRTGQWGSAAVAAWRYLGLKLGEREPEEARPIPSGADASVPAALPPWLRAEFIERTGLRERAHAFWFPPANDHPWHPRAIGSFGTPVWQTLLAGLEADEFDAPLVWRHPYLDLRVLDFLLSVPPVPWARRKLVMREAMAGRLPAPLLSRRKTPLDAKPLHRALHGRQLPLLESTVELDRWLDLAQLPRQPDQVTLAPLLAVHALDYWLR